MTLTRTILVLVGALVVGLCAVILRTEAARHYYAVSQFDREAGELREAIDEAQIQRARWRIPERIRQEVGAYRLQKVIGSEATGEAAGNSESRR